MPKNKTNSILLADDSQTFLMYVGILVKRLGYQIYLAKDGVEAIKLAKEKKPSIIVLDYIMPRIDGSSCLSIIRKDNELMDTPVIILTSSDREAVSDECKKLGCCYFLRKPVNVTEFHSAIRKCLGSNNLRKNIRTSLNLRVSVTCGDEKRDLSALALSHEGMFLRTAAPFGVDTELNVIFSIDDEDPVDLKGKVIYTNKLSTELHTEPGMGIKFIDVPEDIKYRLYYYVMENISNDLSIEDKNFDREIKFDENLS